ncbi:hypothetical protein M9H77_30655 [Catharanthus roseus]|uniref:Uncharacterized protein n=1 Tax=Catharanthus roseus TaxID=4058 RepID=A0ACC0A256_CATRO|nr:hypothetical protein M9H77_30655 [Catharanthus roseus]
MGVRLFVIERSYFVGWYLTTRCRNLVPMASFWGSGLCLWNPTVVLHISSERSGAQQATEVLGQEFLDQISPEGHIFIFYLFGLEASCVLSALVCREARKCPTQLQLT